MVAALIKIEQGVSLPPPGQALIGVPTTPVEFSNDNNAGVDTWTWEVVDSPPGSTVTVGVISSGPLSTLTIVPDLPGGYLVRLTVEDERGNRSIDERVFAIPEPSGMVIPPYAANDKAMNFGGQLRGWAKYVEAILRFILGAFPRPCKDVGGSGVPEVIPATLLDYAFAVDGSLNDVDILLPSLPPKGLEFFVFDRLGSFGVNAVTIDGNGNTINGAATFPLTNPYAACVVFFDGASWIVKSNI